MEKYKSPWPDQLRKFLGGQIFGAQFRKADGSLRSGSFRLGVKRVTGQGLGYDAENRGNLIVWDMTKGAYRTIVLNRLERLCVRGREILL